MANDFLGKGWKFKLGEAPDVGLGTDNGRIAEASGEEVIRQSIWLILSTAPGERVARPDFGCGIHDLVFGTTTGGALGAVSKAVGDALTRFEPRIDVIEVDSEAHPSEPNLVVIQIQYSVRATNSRFNLVYPFYLS